MEIISVGEFKAHFSELLKRVLAGEEIGIAYGRNKEIVAKLVPRSSANNRKRRLGILENKAKAIFKPDFKMTEEEFLGL
jgi:antitoxin (DNA-binding transcriptional repressor) of toxin-antitoxin stability system